MSMKTFKINTTNLDKLTQLLELVSERSAPILEEIATRRLVEDAAFLYDQLYDTKSHIEE